MKKLKIVLMSAFCISAFIACEKETQPEVSEQTQTKNALSGGQSGSMSQFTIVGDYLYTVDYRFLHVFHLADPDNPAELEKINLGVGIETIFPQDGYLFVGTQNGVRIYDITNPRSPVEVSTFDHVTSCDPVVANEQLAAATLRGGTECGGNLNELDIIDISNIQQPAMVSTYTLTNPYGLGFSEVNAAIVYVCDGYAGLKAFDVSDPSNIQLVMDLPDYEAIDVLSTDNNGLIVLTAAGIYQFDATDPVNLVQKSFIPSL